jgi:hypothetical protein
MKAAVSLSFVLFLSVSALAQQYNWFKQFGGPEDERVAHMQIDNDGHLILVGNFENTVDFDFSSGVTEASSNGYYDVFVAKYDTTGALIWLRTFGSAQWDYVNTLLIDADNNIYIGGNYGATMDIDPGPGETLLVPSGGLSAYVLKLNEDGAYQWSRNLTGGIDLRIKAIKNGPQGVVVGGSFWGTCQFNNEGSSVELTSVSSSQDVFVLTVDNAGAFVDVKQVGNSGQNMPKGFDVDTEGNIYFSCEFEGSIDVDPGPGTTTLVANNPSDYRQFVAKYSPTMELIWAKMPMFPSYSQIRHITVPSNDEIVLLGCFKDSIQFADFGDLDWYFPVGDDDQFVAKINGAGELLWIRTYGNEFEDDNAKMYIDPAGNIYLYDRFEGTMDMDPGSGIVEATSIGTTDQYLLKLDSDGEFKWFIQDSTDYPNSYYIGAVAGGGLNDLYIAYNFYQEMGIIQNGIDHNFTSNGDFDVLLIQMKADNFLALQENGKHVFSVHPNPVAQYLHISGITSPEAIPFRVVNMAGQAVLSGSTDGQIDMSALDSGMYILQLNEGSYRIVVE